MLKRAYGTKYEILKRILFRSSVACNYNCSPNAMCYKQINFKQDGIFSNRTFGDTLFLTIKCVYVRYSKYVIWIIVDLNQILWTVWKLDSLDSIYYIYIKKTQCSSSQSSLFIMYLWKYFFNIYSCSSSLSFGNVDVSFHWNRESLELHASIITSS